MGCAAMACATAPLSAADDARVRAIVEQVRTHAYPELNDVALSFDTFSADDVFFQSNFALLPALVGERRYTLYTNPRVFDRVALRSTLPSDALPGVLAHELAHTLDYHTRDRTGLLALLPALLFDDDTARFERWTDLQTIARGYGPALLKYRRWQRTVLTPAQWAHKRSVYYDADDIALLLDVRGRCPAVFYGFFARIPTQRSSMVTHCP